jgi:hypothetical protein
MAIWTIVSNVEVVYQAEDERHQCGGEPDSAMLAEVEDWVVHEAAPWDMLISPSGVFVRCESPIRPV